MPCGSVPSTPAGGCAKRCTSVAFAIAPNSAAPTALPIARQNMLVPVTTPRRSQPTTDCTATMVGEEDRPMPMPVRNIVAATSHTAAPSGSSAVSTEPVMTMAIPISAVSRKPIRM